MKTDLVEVAPAAETLGSRGFEHDERDPLGALARAGLGDDNNQVGQLAVSDEGLLSVEPIGIAVRPGGGAHGLQVRPGSGFGHRDCTHPFAARQPGQPPLLLLLGAVAQDVMRDDRRVDAVPRRELGDDAFQVLDDRGVVGERSALPAIGFRHARQQRSDIAERAPSRTVHDLVLPPAFGARCQLPGQEATELVTKSVQLLGHPGRAIGAGHAAFRSPE